MSYIYNINGSATGTQRLGSITVRNGRRPVSSQPSGGDFNGDIDINIATITGYESRFDFANEFANGDVIVSGGTTIIGSGSGTGGSYTYDSNLVPTSNNTYDLGQPGSIVRNIYSNREFTNGLVVSGNITGTNASFNDATITGLYLRDQNQITGAPIAFIEGKTTGIHLKMLDRNFAPIFVGATKFSENTAQAFLSGSSYPQALSVWAGAAEKIYLGADGRIVTVADIGLGSNILAPTTLIKGTTSGIKLTQNDGVTFTTLWANSIRFHEGTNVNYISGNSNGTFGFYANGSERINVNSYTINFDTLGSINFSASSPSASNDLSISRLGPGRMIQRSLAGPNEYIVANAHASTSTGEWLRVGWQNNTGILIAEASGTGINRPLLIRVGSGTGLSQITLGTDGIVSITGTGFNFNGSALNFASNTLSLGNSVNNGNIIMYGAAGGAKVQTAASAGTLYGNTMTISWDDTANVAGNSNTRLNWGGKGHIVAGMSANPHNISVANTYTSNSNGEWLRVGWSNNSGIITTDASGAGLSRPLSIQAGSGTNTSRLVFGTNGVITGHSSIMPGASNINLGAQNNAFNTIYATTGYHDELKLYDGANGSYARIVNSDLSYTFYDAYDALAPIGAGAIYTATIVGINNNNITLLPTSGALFVQNGNSQNNANIYVANSNSSTINGEWFGAGWQDNTGIIRTTTSGTGIYRPLIMQAGSGTGAVQLGLTTTGLYAKTSILAAASVASTHKIPINISGMTYYLLATNV